MIPFEAGKVTSVVPQAKPQNSDQLYKQIEGKRQGDFELPAITEEKPGATGTNETNEYKVPENYPLRQPRAFAEVLLVSYGDIKNVMETKIGFKCDESYMEDNGMEKIHQRIRDVQDGKRPFYKYVLVDIDDVTIIIERFGRSIKRALNDAKIPFESV